MSDVIGKRVEGFSGTKEKYTDAPVPGAFWWLGDPPRRLHFVCPCGCGDIGGIAVAKDLADRDGNHPIWTWNGDEDKPTTTPSILFTAGCKWHGYLTDGVFRSC